MKISSLFLFFLIVNSLLTTLPLYAQFSYEVIEDNSGYEYEKPVEFYWTPRYNRVEGLFLNFGAKLHPRTLPNLQFYGNVGVGFWNQANKQFRFTAGFRKDFFDINRLSLGGEIFRNVESEDDWIIGNVENTLSSLLFREDYKDYYGAQGFKIYVDHRFKGIHTLHFEISRRTYDTLKRNINWSVFGGNFDENPSRSDSFIAEGDEIGLKFITAFDWRDNPVFPLSGWYVEAMYERTFEDFNTDGLFLTVKRFQQFWGNQRLFMRGMVGTRHGSLAEQHTIDIGGIGSLRGFDDKEFSGNRMVMLNANYLFGGDVLQKFPVQNVPILGAIWTTLSFGLFLDTGWAWVANPNDSFFDGFGKLTFDNLKTDVGFSIFVLEGLFRLDVAKRMDRSHDDFRVTFRLLEKL